MEKFRAAPPGRRKEVTRPEPETARRRHSQRTALGMEELRMRRIGLVLLLAAALTLLPGRPAAAAPAGAAQPPTQLYTVVFGGWTLPPDASALVRANGGEITVTVPEIGVLEARAGGGFVGGMLACPGVLTVGPSLPLALERLPAEPADLPLGAADLTGPGDYYRLYQWDIKRVTRDGASYALGTGSHRTVVAVVDTGFFPHPDVAMNFLGGRNLIPAGGFGDDPTETGDPNDYWDRHGHGTHCAGTIAANGKVYGVGPDLGLRAYRVLTREGSGTTAWVAAGIVAAVKDGCRVVSMSLGGYDVKGQYWWTDPVTGETYRLGNDVASFLAYRRAVEFASRNDTVVVAAAGNDALDVTRRHDVTEWLNEQYGVYGYTFVGATVESPGSVPGVITVSATGPGDLLSSYSNYGPGFIDLAGPGGDFRRYPNPGWYTDMCLNCYGKYLPNGQPYAGYAWMAGTSMATPKVAAVAALLADRHPGYSAAQIKALLLQTADDIGKPGTDGLFGFGLVDAFSALAAK